MSSNLEVGQPDFISLFREKSSIDKSFQFRRTVDTFPNVKKVQRVQLGDAFLSPSDQEVAQSTAQITDYFSKENVGILLPVASMRERESFLRSLAYVLQMGFRQENIFIIYTKMASRIMHSLQDRYSGCHFIEEDTSIENLFEAEKILEFFGVDIKNRRGKGRGFMCAFAYMQNQVKNNHKLTDLFFMDVDINPRDFFPLHYLGYAKIQPTSQECVSLLTAQNNSYRDNHSLFSLRDPWRMENEVGARYADHLDKLVWSLTGEFCMDFASLGDSIPFTAAYGIETIWQLFIGDFIAQNNLGNKGLVQVSNPHPKIDGGTAGISGRCFDTMMLRQITYMSYLLIKRGKAIIDWQASDYLALNSVLATNKSFATLPDYEDHGAPLIATCTVDQFLPPLSLLREKACLKVAG